MTVAKLYSSVCNQTPASYNRAIADPAFLTPFGKLEFGANAKFVTGQKQHSLGAAPKNMNDTILLVLTRS